MSHWVRLFFYLIILGTVSSDVLINKLQDAIKRKDKAALDRAIRECVAAGLPELDDVIHKAREFSDIMKGGSGG